MQKNKNYLFLFVLSCLPFILSGCLQVPEWAQVGPLKTYQVSLPPAAPEEPLPIQTPPLYCAVGHGSALFGNQWHEFPDTLFELYENQRINVMIQRLNGTDKIVLQAFFDPAGQKLIFCPMSHAVKGQTISCSSIYALDDDLQEGIKRTYEVPNAITGSAITCAYQQDKLKALSVYAPNAN